MGTSNMSTVNVSVWFSLIHYSAFSANSPLLLCLCFVSQTLWTILKGNILQLEIVLHFAYFPYIPN